LKPRTAKRTARALPPHGARANPNGVPSEETLWRLYGNDAFGEAAMLRAGLKAASVELVSIQAHLPALHLRLPPTLHFQDVICCRRCSRNFQDRHLIVAGIPTLENHITAVACVDIVLPTTPEAFPACSRTDILLSCLRTCEQINPSGGSERSYPAIRQLIEP
jgi:hypothetical protein